MVQSGNSDGAKLQLRIKFRSEDLEGFVERYGTDVSPGGIFIRSRQPLAVGTRVVFAFSLMNGVPVLNGEGTIVWVRQPEGETGGNPGMGIRFDVLNDESRMKLSRILEAKAAREKSGKPPMRGPTPIPDGPFGGASLASAPSDATAKVRLTPDGQIVQDMPVPRPSSVQPSVPGYTAPIPSPSGPAPSKPYASSLSNPQMSLPRPPQPTPTLPDRDRTRLTPPPAEALRRSTPALGTETSPQPFAPSKTLGNAAAPVLGPGGSVVRTPQSLPNRSPTPAFGTDVTRGAGGAAFSSTMAFGQEPTRSAEAGLRAEPTRGVTPAPDLLRRATPPPVPVTPPPSVFSRPTPVPGVPLADLRSGARSGPVVNRPTGSRPAVVDPPPQPSPAASAWSSEKTEIVEDLPRFDEMDEKTTTVRGQTLAAQEGFGDGFGEGVGANREAIVHQQPTRPELATQPAASPPEVATKSFPSMPVLLDLFEGEQLPEPGESSPLMPAADEFGRVESTGRGPRVTPVPGASMIARKVETTEFRVQKRRPVLWLVFGGVAVAAGVFAVTNYVDSQRPNPPVANLAPPAPEPPAPAAEVPKAAPPPVAEPAAPEPAAAAEAPAAAPEPAPAPPDPKPMAAKVAPVAPEAPKPAKPIAAKPVVAVRPAPRPVAPAPKPAAAAPVPAEPDADAVYWLRVRSTPPGADVYLDGELEGQTPFQRRIFDSTRPYAISVRKEGFESAERMISASDPWTKVRNEYLLTLTLKLRKTAAEPAAPAEPAGVEAPAAPESAPAP
ncbi:MAG: TIGR02266 family protein [Deltaproteobacteria bacterium]|nr:TIGR02266 family protein [Deltaproteobacteria bacterium]